MNNAGLVSGHGLPATAGVIREVYKKKYINTVSSSQEISPVKLNRRQAIKARCADCSGGIRDEVRDCTRQGCALHHFRTGRGKQSPKARDKAIRDFCGWCVAGQRLEVRRCHLSDCPLHHFRISNLKADTGRIEASGRRKVAPEGCSSREVLYA